MTNKPVGSVALSEETLDRKRAAQVRALEPEFSDEQSNQVLEEVLVVFRSATAERVSDNVLTHGGEHRRADAPVLVRKSGVPGRKAVWLMAALSLGAMIVAWANWEWTRGDDSGQRVTQLEGGKGTAITRDLRDGSQMILAKDASAHLRVETERRIEVEQQQGLIEYHITKRPGRVFAVLSGAVRVEVRGTVFTINREPNQVTVFVREGSVSVQRLGDPEVLLGRGESWTDAVKVARDGSGDQKSNPGRGGPEASSEVSVGAPDLVAPEARSPGQVVRSVNLPLDVEAADSDKLFEEAQRLRASGQLEQAGERLRHFVTSFPNDGRVTSAYFQLGRVERSRGDHARAADAFLQASRRAGNGTLGADATLEEAVSRKAAGQTEMARAVAARYLRNFPNGEGRAQMLQMTR